MSSAGAGVGKPRYWITWGAAGAGQAAATVSVREEDVGLSAAAHRLTTAVERLINVVARTMAFTRIADFSFFMRDHTSVNQWGLVMFRTPEICPEWG